jgi:predicted RNA polymerase sigma factor
MGELSDHAQREFERFAAIWLAPLVAVLLRAVHDAALAYDLATETLAAARSRWVPAANPTEDDDGSAWLIGLADRAGGLGAGGCGGAQAHAVRRASP